MNTKPKTKKRSTKQLADRIRAGIRVAWSRVGQASPRAVCEASKVLSELAMLSRELVERISGAESAATGLLAAAELLLDNVTPCNVAMAAIRAAVKESRG